MGLAHFRYGFTICCVRNDARRESPTEALCSSECARHEKAELRRPQRVFRSAEQSCGKPQLRGQPTNRALRAQRFLDDVLLRRRRQQQH